VVQVLISLTELKVQDTIRGSRFNKVMDLYLNYNKKVDAIDTQIDATGGYTYQDFRDVNDGSSLISK
jgi:hypothetical protein